MQNPAGAPAAADGIGNTASAVGVYQGVTSFVDAGGPGIDVIDQFMELLWNAIAYEEFRTWTTGYRYE